MLTRCSLKIVLLSLNHTQSEERTNLVNIYLITSFMVLTLHTSVDDHRFYVIRAWKTEINCFALWQYRFTKKHQYFFYAQPQGQMTTNHSDKFTSCEHVWFSDKITDQSQHVWFSNKRTDLPQHVWCPAFEKEEVRCHNKTRWSITECLTSKQKKWLLTARQMP